MGERRRQSLGGEEGERPKRQPLQLNPGRREASGLPGVPQPQLSTDAFVPLYEASPAPGLTYQGARALLAHPAPPALPKCGPRGGRSLPGPATGTVTDRPGDRASATARDTYLGEGRRTGA